MSGEDYLELFKAAYSQWLCDPYSVEIRFVAKKGHDCNRLMACAVNFWPIGTNQSESLRVVANDLIAGREQITDCSLKDLMNLMENLEQGKLTFKDISLVIEAKEGLSYYSEMISNDRWFCDAHLLINGDALNPFSSTEFTKIDSELRLAELPFDGIEDLLNFLSLPDTLSNHKQTQIEVRIYPPVDVLIDESSLSNNQLNLTLHAHPTLDTKTISLAIQEFSNGSSIRKQVAPQIEWKPVENQRQVGNLSLNTENAFAIKAVLMAGRNTVRRRFFEDILKVPNRRLFNISVFDNELKRLKKDLTDTNNSDHFEKAVNSLAYILGFSGCVMNETEAPDLILSTKNDNLVIIECTLKVSDFHTKLGKLVDRKNTFIEFLKKSGDNRKVHSYLITGQSKTAIPHDEKLLLNHDVVLLTKESIVELLENLRFPQEPDDLLLADERHLESLRASI